MAKRINWKKLGLWLVGSVTTVILGLIGWGIYEYYHNKYMENRLLEVIKVDENKNSVDVTVNNPSTRPYLVTGASFKVLKQEKPGERKCGDMIGKIEVAFKPTDYDLEKDEYVVKLGHDKIPSIDINQFHVKFVDPSHVGWIYSGVFTVYYGIENHPEIFSERISLTVTDGKR